MTKCDTDEMPNESGHAVVPAITEIPIMSRMRSSLRNSGNFWLLLGFSFFYFADVCIRASEKYFWYDEFFTLYLSRLPTVSLWDALKHGADFNPPLLYLLTKASQSIFGPGLLGTRMPEIIGFWVMCLCLFQFVNRRTGPVAGAVAMLLPMLTGAFYYAYEARPFAIILGCCGLALVCWQRALDAPRRGRWLTGFSFALLAAFMLHCYALLIVVPFALSEVFRTIRSKHIDWPMWIAQIAPVVPAVLTYIALLHAYGRLSKNTNFARLFAPDRAQIGNFYLFLLAPCVLILLLAGILLALARMREWAGNEPPRRKVNASAPEIVLAICFIALPIFGVVLAELVHGPFFARYFLSATVGVCLLAGLAAGARHRTNWVAITLAITISCTVGLQFALLLRHRNEGWYDPVIEPSSGLPISTTPGKPLESYSLLPSSKDPNLPVLVVGPLDFLTLVHYRPALAPRLYYLAGGKDDFFYEGYRNFRQWCFDKYNDPLIASEALGSGHEFLVYGGIGGLTKLSSFLRYGAEIKLLKVSKEYFLAEVNANPAQRAEH